MPRTGGVYSPPAGTKGVPNTTIQSVPYNTLIDDLTADANAPRPVTAGGTGATSASAARSALGVEIGTNVQAYDPALQSIAGLTTVANQMTYTTGTDLYSTTALTPFARTILDDADAAGVKSTLGLAAVASSGSASDLTVGTIADSRLPGTMTAKNFTGKLNICAGSSTSRADFIELIPNDYASGKPGLFFQKASATGTWGLNVWDGTSITGTIDINSTNLRHNGVPIVTAVGGTFTGNIVAPDITATGGDFIVQSNGNRHVWFQSSSGVNRGLVYHDNGGDPGVGVLTYNTSGANNQALHLKESGWAMWTGHVVQFGTGGNGDKEFRIACDADTFFRWYYAADGNWYFQRSNNSGFSAATTFISGGGNNIVNMPGCDLSLNSIQTNNTGNGTNVKIGNDSWIGDVNKSNSVAIRGQQDFGKGRLYFGNDTVSLGSSGISGRLYYGDQFFIQSDGNMYLPFTGFYLNQVLMGRGQWWQDHTGGRSVNTVYQNTSGAGICVSIQATNMGNSLFQCSTDGSNWQTIGLSVYDATSGGVSLNMVSQGPYTVPHGSYYRLTGGAGFQKWMEMRN